MTLPSSGPLSLKNIATEIGYPTYYNSSTISNTLNGITGLTLSAIQSNYDDYNIGITMPFTVSFLGLTYSTVYVGSNSYLTFGTGSSNYSGLSGSNPPYPAIQISSGDNSFQRVYYGYGTNAGGAYVIRYEGNGYTSGTPGSPGMVWEVWFRNGSTQIDIHVGVNNKGTNGTYGISNGSAYIMQPIELRQSNNSIRLTVNTGLHDFSLKKAAQGNYSTINLYGQPNNPAASPYTIGSWHGYNHLSPTSVSAGMSYNQAYNGVLLSDFFYVGQTTFYGLSYSSDGVTIYTDQYRHTLAGNDFYYYNGSQVFYGNPLTYIEDRSPSYIYLNNNWVDGGNNLFIQITTDIAPTNTGISIPVYWEWYDSNYGTQSGVVWMYIAPGNTSDERRAGYVNNYGGDRYMSTLYFNGPPSPTYDSAGQVYLQG